MAEDEREDGRDAEPNGDRPVEASASGASGPGSGDGAPPVRIGHYLVETEIGRGGMGVVYRALDERLGRTVALKTLPAGTGLGTAAWTRLEREAKLLARVAHPNVATIHALETGDGRPSLVLEHVDGVSLAERLHDGALEMPEALRVTAQIAAALEAAHGLGVVHRDLKPANVMVAIDGTVKVLDFGLSRAMQASEELLPGTPPADDTDLSSSAGVLGTLSYLSPEQLRGEAADERVDLWAFGCILFEALTGIRAWGTGSAAERVRAILDADLEWSALPLELPSGIRQLLEHCLEPDRSLRLADAGVAREQLAAALGGLASATEGRKPRRPASLPRQLPSFVGRTAEVQRLDVCLAEPGISSVVGLGGCGKTRLALEVAARCLGELDTVGFVDVSPLSERTALAPALASALQVQVPRDGSATDALREALAGSKALVVLDGCEHLLASCAELALALVEAGPEVRVLATSRDRLGVPGERVLRLEPLRLPERAATDAEDAAPASSDALELFLVRAREAVPDLELSAGQRVVAARICRRLDGLPLALELAAARLRALSLEQLDQRLDDRFRLLRDRRRSGARHATLQAIVDWSHEQLETDERILLRRLSIFQGSFTLGAAEEACAFDGLEEADILDALSSLLDRSLVSVDRRGVEVRHRLLDTVRDHAHLKLLESGEEAAAASAHLDWALGAADRDRQLLGPEALRVLDRLDEIHAELLAALARACEQPDLLERGGRLAGRLPRFWQLRGHLETARPLVARLVDAGRGREPGAGHAAALWCLGEVDYYRNALASAGRSYEQARELAERLGDQATLGSAINGLGLVANAEGRPDQARDAFEAWRRILVARGDDALVPLADANLAVAAHRAGRKDEAESRYGEVLDQARRMGNRELAALATQNLGVLAFESGRNEVAAKHLAEALRLRELLRDARGLTRIRVNLALTRWSSGQPEEARRDLLEALEDARRLGAREALVTILNNLACIEMELGDLEAARSHGLAGLKRCPPDSIPALTLAENVGRIELRSGRARKAAIMTGAAEAHRARARLPRHQLDAEQHAKDLVRLRADLGDGELEAALDRGRQLSLADLVELALDGGDEATAP